MPEQNELGAIREALAGLEQKLDQGLASLLQGQGFLHTSIADTRRDIRALDDKLVRIQEAMYFFAHKKLEDHEAEEFRAMLPDPPKQRKSFEKWPQVLKEG